VGDIVKKKKKVTIQLSRNYCPGAVNLPDDEWTFRIILSAPEKARAPGQ
jgi:hypothetical protein